MAGHFSLMLLQALGLLASELLTVPPGSGVTCGLKGVEHLLDLKKYLWIFETWSN